MFEYDQDIVQTLLAENIQFRRLYEKHGDLKQQVEEANLGEHPMDDLSLETLKKQKLYLKDQMANMIASYRKAHV